MVIFNGHNSRLSEIHHSSFNIHHSNPNAPAGGIWRRRRCRAGSSAGSGARWPGWRPRYCARDRPLKPALIKNDSPTRVIVEVLPEVALAGQVDRRAERRKPLRAHPVAVGKGEQFAVDRAFQDSEAHVQAAARRPAEERADGDDLLPLIEEVEDAVAHQRQAIADVPGDSCNPAAPPCWPKSSRLGSGKIVTFVSNVIQSMMWRLSAGPRLVCHRWSTPSRMAVQIAGDFRARRSDPALAGRSAGRRAARRTSPMPGHGRPSIGVGDIEGIPNVVVRIAPPERLDRIVVQRIVQRQVVPGSGWLGRRRTRHRKSTLWAMP